MEAVSTGIPTLDSNLVGGLPKGNTVLIYGSPGSGMELFAKQFAQAGAESENVVYITTSERDDDILSTLERYKWSQDVNILNLSTMYYEQILAKQLEISRYRQEGIQLDDIRSFTQNKDEKVNTNFLTILTYGISKLEPPFRVVIDSLDFFLEHYEHEDVIATMRTIKAHTLHTGSVALITMNKGVYSTRTHSSIEGIADCIIELGIKIEEKDLKRYMFIQKLLNYPNRVGVLNYKFTDKGFSATE